ncbi:MULTISPECIES: flagellar export chaperone FliS [Pseudoalteromonas]|uniref:Flagellar secretion chaperone FliS n=1 Tax=Pseudoalteromonas fuliginea TaxID=1872678 RepID=A0ABD3Y514_9GAMM|nr:MULTISPECIES: flagellar export chaperone FliS [Pseudoalteromonas]ALQ08966.1 flagellar export chaperone FliS [Pseudoalteromonas sp. Bsw20308]ATG76843.1 flagellar export chaperone FliS [Pseudoalteromonas sp. 1_2015MBL_MicDiv]KAA1154021.1 flagellar export chaperone FliS [Pseudoalteromonas fuliginea]KAA1166639.1 flagellar export chaperone FliS [Pseudoalteromonas fuliginea]KDC49264.1 flagellar biosynthesis protein FliS [Pseudoalteromonas fuliginea]
MAHVSVKKYSQVRVSNIAEMTPYEQINLIFSNIIGRLAATKGFIERKEIEKKGENISACVLLFGALQDALNLEVEQDPSISNNLLALYDYCQRTLTKANLNNDVDAVLEVSNIVKEIKEGWDNIPVDQRVSAV